MSEKLQPYTSGKIIYLVNDQVSSTEDPPSVPKRYNHHHFWINKGTLYESYQISANEYRYIKIKDVPGMPDEDVCTPACIDYIYKNYYGH